MREAGLDDVTCLVRGPGSRYPRGFLLAVPVWFAILTVVVLFVGHKASGHVPLWLGITEIGGLLVAAIIAGSVLATVRRRAFRADAHGIWLGCRTTRKRPKLRQVHLAWPEIAQIRLLPRRYGALLEITLGPSARIVQRPSLARQTLLLLGTLLLPFAVGRGRPGLTMPRANPPRYLVKICDLTPVQLRAELAAVQPGTVPVRLMTKKAQLRLTVPPPRTPAAGRPASPVG
jgi:hypothetical protein